jgi:3-deoxy-7-phosphoheptulonate synthase
VARAADLAVGTPLPRYESGCDPRLNPAQAEEVVRLAASLAVEGAA